MGRTDHDYTYTISIVPPGPTLPEIRTLAPSAGGATMQRSCTPTFARGGHIRKYPDVSTPSGATHSFVHRSASHGWHHDSTPLSDAIAASVVHRRNATWPIARHQGILPALCLWASRSYRSEVSAPSAGGATTQILSLPTCAGGGTPAGPQTYPRHWVPTSASLATRRFTRRLACIGRYQSPNICSFYRWPRRSRGVGCRNPGPALTVTIQPPPGARVGLAPAAAQSRTGAGPSYHLTTLFTHLSFTLVLMPGWLIEEPSGGRWGRRCALLLLHLHGTQRHRWRSSYCRIASCCCKLT